MRMIFKEDSHERTSFWRRSHGSPLQGQLIPIPALAPYLYRVCFFSILFVFLENKLPKNTRVREGKQRGIIVT